MVSRLEKVEYPLGGRTGPCLSFRLNAEPQDHIKAVNGVSILESLRPIISDTGYESRQPMAGQFCTSSMSCVRQEITILLLVIPKEDDLECWQIRTLLPRKDRDISHLSEVQLSLWNDLVSVIEKALVNVLNARGLRKLSWQEAENEFNLSHSDAGNH